MHPPCSERVSGKALHTVSRKQPPQKKLRVLRGFLGFCGTYGGAQKIFQKNPLTGPLHSHSVPRRMERGEQQVPKFEITFQSLIEVKRTYECDDKDQAREYGQMDAEDGQIGDFYSRNCVSGEVTECAEIKT